MASWPAPWSAACSWSNPEQRTALPGCRAAAPVASRLFAAKWKSWQAIVQDGSPSPWKSPLPRAPTRTNPPAASTRRRHDAPVPRPDGDCSRRPARHAPGYDPLQRPRPSTGPPGCRARPRQHPPRSAAAASVQSGRRCRPTIHRGSAQSNRDPVRGQVSAPHSRELLLTGPPATGQDPFGIFPAHLSAGKPRL